MIRYWLTAPKDAHLNEIIASLCGLYQQAPELAKQGETTVCTDEMTGIQALERKHPGVPMAPGKVERREFEYVRHGTLSLIVSRDVVTGTILAPASGPTRNEADFLAHMQEVIATNPQAVRWHIVCDNLNTHQSASLVEWVAQISEITDNLGIKGLLGILALQSRRAAFLSDPTHKVVFHYTPKHSSWMNQIEIWLGILVRKLLKRSSFLSVKDLQAKILAFIAYYNRTMAKPFKWISQGKALVA